MGHGEQDGLRDREPESGLTGREPLLSGTKVILAAREAGVSELAVTIARDTAVWCASGYSEAEWREDLASRHAESRDEVEQALREIKEAGLWPWE